MTAPSAQIHVTPELLERFISYHKENGAWGSLHIVLDDLNLDDCHVDFCIQYASEHSDQEGYELGLILKSMSKTQRKKIADKA